MLALLLGMLFPLLQNEDGRRIISVLCFLSESCQICMEKAGNQACMLFIAQLCTSELLILKE
jgi:hypothetical protein